jgi:hypothetical protein
VSLDAPDRLRRRDRPPGDRGDRGRPRENLGRLLFTVDFDGGPKLILFAHEIEAVSEELAA